ncbi:hypothetical protein FISHEDRAFT_53788 [Fistulina hepatica ATCC 64428]|uniref:Zn(2)-C6 fungal-type domain-containing protein n=1 Tax=Fistulina hepatica ATCC 64428 TaxID=1128425 RepID=A0A0D7A0I1_9AGAR|nr:hypothetical protein FISHEDRAFT_53788 [Fistulina hepatica ATCC 64428]
MSVKAPLTAEFLNKDGSVSRMRSHSGNVPVLPQTKLCPHCPAKFTRTTHLNRHMRNHTNERMYACETCGAEFTRSDLLTRHKKSCNNPITQARRKACVACTESKIKCDREIPCSKCKARDRTCIYPAATKRTQSRRRLGHTARPITVDSAASTSANPPADSGSPEAAAASKSEVNSFLEGASAASSSFDAGSSASPNTAPSNAASVPTRSHLSAMYQNNMFQPFFSEVFGQSDATNETATDATNETMETYPSDEADTQLNAYATRAVDGYSRSEKAFTSRSDYIGREAHAGSSVAGYSNSSSIYLFYSMHCPQVPLVHVPTFKFHEASANLKDAMLACGALFARTSRATSFIAHTLSSVRDKLMHELTTNGPGLQDPHFFLSVALLQIIGIFHQNSQEREAASRLHSMVVMTIRRHGLIRANAAWQPLSMLDSPLEVVWRDWVEHEGVKRALTLTFLHDCCCPIYFGTMPNFQLQEITLGLPANERLWNASTADAWLQQLQDTVYGNMHNQLLGFGLPAVLQQVCAPRVIERPFPLSPFAHFVTVHCILRSQFMTFAARPPVLVGVNAGEDVRQELFLIQYALHNWFQSWLASPDMPKMERPDDEPPFLQHSLPFYWLGQIALLAYQECLMPFDPDGQMTSDMRFRTIKRWLQHSRDFTKMGNKAPTLFWDELMKIRLQTWQVDTDVDTIDPIVGENDPGMLSFFTEH